MDFWYQAFVSSDTVLNIYMQNGSSPAVIIWRRPGTTARDQWTYGSVNLGTIHGSMHLTISGKIQFLKMNFVFINLILYDSGCCTSYNWLCCSR